jgi:hypothetical protein
MLPSLAMALAPKLKSVPYRMSCRLRGESWYGIHGPLERLNAFAIMVFQGVRLDVASCIGKDFSSPRRSTEIVQGDVMRGIA